jgi:DNA-binding transcriptional ArsR family regulator
MEEAPCISQIASLLAEPKRTAMLWSLMDGSAKSSEELATLAGLSPASANAHLARLTGSGLLRIEGRRGKRLFRVAATDVSVAIDALACTTLASAARSAPHASPPVLVAPPLLRHARLCQGHLGGELAAGLYERMLAAGWIERHEQRIGACVATGVRLFRLEPAATAPGRRAGCGAVAVVPAIELDQPGQRIPGGATQRQRAGRNRPIGHARTTLAPTVTAA